MVAAATPQAPAALLTKKLRGNVMVMELTEAAQPAVAGGRVVEVVNANVALCAVFPATRLAKGIVIETPVTRRD